MTETRLIHLTETDARSGLVVDSWELKARLAAGTADVVTIGPQWWDELKRQWTREVTVDKS